MSSPEAPSVSVVVATRGRAENLGALTAAVLEDEAVQALVVVIDGEDPASFDEVRSLARRFDRLRYRQIPHAGHLRALEVGASMTTSDVIVFLDDDVLPTPGLARAHALGHRDEAQLVLVGSMPVELSGRSGVGSILYAKDYLGHCSDLEAGTRDVLDHLWMGNVSIRRGHCEVLGLASSFPCTYHEDRDLGLRLKEAGLEGRFDARLRAVHRHQRTDRAFLEDARRSGEGLAYLHAFHPTLGPFDPNVFAQGLPRPVGKLVATIGSSSLARAGARLTLSAAAVIGAAGWPSGRLRFARLARRLMFMRGATQGQRQVTSAAPPTCDVRRSPMTGQLSSAGRAGPR